MSRLIQEKTIPTTPGFSFTHGPLEPSLQTTTIGDLLKFHAKSSPDHCALIAPSSSTRLTYSELNDRIALVARALLSSGIKAGDRVGIFAGNTAEWVEVFLATARIGAVAVLLNTFFTTSEIKDSVRFTECSLLFISDTLGSHDLWPCINYLETVMENGRAECLLPDLKEIVIFSSNIQKGCRFRSYETYLLRTMRTSAADLGSIEKRVTSDMVCNFQFTSGTTGLPKAAALSHFNIINNAVLMGQIIRLTRDDIVCCPAPLFHAAGLVLGLIGCLTHGATLVLPSPTFDPAITAQVLRSEQCTAIHGVPTILAAIVASYQQMDVRPPPLRTGILGGSQVSPALLRKVQASFGLQDLGVAYGMTETSPLSYIGTGRHADDTAIWLSIMPHTYAKVIDKQGKIVPTGVPGELCIAGYLLQQGYYRNPEKTQEVMRFDEDKQLLWMHTGDEAIMNENGDCHITGRLKEIIIRGGENVYPGEIEDRLNLHPAIAMSAVVGIEDKKYGEVVGAFLELVGQDPPVIEEIQSWVRQTLGKHKAPQWVFYLGKEGVPDCFPKTGSGKIKKTDLSAIGNRLVHRKGKL
ncbi:hypothetical protein BDV33DRAFT_233320 [Aspergillus novoparasiticus]|uniref:Acetyl-CoA synthetase-like protein n=1 Tax=Aspergillus novoparasiticus TaxID=986946 RepID=A0A5N6EGA4_9EURO|nr:hypothetical protein BDV33DRAFT_233320 [Aspergillus novoparasiticus]